MKKIKYLIVSLLILPLACSEEPIVETGLISGKLQYKNAITGVIEDVPAGTPVSVKFETPDGFSFYDYSFKTTQKGLYSLKPNVKGTYTLSFAHPDTIMQFNTALVEKLDVDTLRNEESGVIRYTVEHSFILDEGHTFHDVDMLLFAKTTSLKLILHDENKNPLLDIKVCIYDNETFATANSPYCGGALGYLSSDKKGEVLFVGLNAKKYYFNARGNIGVVAVDNQFVDSINESDELIQDVVNTVEVELK